MRLTPSEFPRMAPVLLFSLLLHLVILYGTGRWMLRQGQAEGTAGTVVAYLDLPGPKGEGATPGQGEAAPVAVPAVVSPAATARPSISPGAAAEAPKPVPPARTVPVHPAAAVPGKPASFAGAAAAVVPPGTGASSFTGRVNGEAGARSAGGGGEAAGREAVAAGTAALRPAGLPGTASVASPRATPGDTESARELRGSYLALLRRLIEAHKEYPLAARKSGREGSCRRRFVLRRDGSLQRMEAASSCGHPFLDAAASRAVSSVGNFPPPPADLALDEPFEVTITFTLAAR